MKRKTLLTVFLLGCFFVTASFLRAATVGQVTAQTTRMSPQTLVDRFQLKRGDTFSPDEYEKAQDDLHKLRVFKKLQFTATPKCDVVDIHIDAQDDYYIFPMAFITGGAKNNMGVSVAAGNLFKQGESTFAFAGGGSDGFTTRLGANWGNHFVTASYTQLHFDQRFYQNYWENVYGVFNTTDDKEKHQDQLLRETRSRQDGGNLLYAYRLSRTLRASIRPELLHVRYADKQLDSGDHNHITAGLTWSDDIRAGMNMGALAGLGLTDKQKSLQNLPRVRYGHTAAVYYTEGGSWLGSDYNVSKLTVEGSFLVELKSRHLWTVQLKAQDAFNASFTDQITSTDLLTGAGRYDRQHRGTRGAGVGTSFVFYLLRNQTGLLSVTPFYELAYTYTNGAYRPHSGAGALLAYKLWRFPLPVGISYTHNLQDGSNQAGFVIGGAF